MIAVADQVARTAGEHAGVSTGTAGIAGGPLGHRRHRENATRACTIHQTSKIGHMSKYVYTFDTLKKTEREFFRLEVYSGIAKTTKKQLDFCDIPDSEQRKRDSVWEALLRSTASTVMTTSRRKGELGEEAG